MSLDPAASPWAGVLSATAFCLWISAIGAPLAHAAFGHRPRSVWPYYAPILGVVAVLLTTNLSAHLWPGQPSAWVGVLAPSTLSVVVAWRGGAHGRVSKGAALRLTGLATAAAGLFVFALANRLHFWFIDESWHFALAQRMAKGEFPPVTPYGIDAGIGYHYGADLLAASVMNITDAPVWTVYYVLLSFLTVALILAAIGFAWDVGSPLPLAVGAGVALGLFGGDVHVGLPPYVEASGDDRGLAGFIGGLAPAETENAATRVAFDWVDQPQWALAAAIVILIAASLETAVARRQAAVLAAAAGVSALAEAAVLVFSGAALGLVGIVRFFRPPAYGRFWLVAALATSALLIALAGGPIADAVLGRGGTTGMVRIEFDPDPDDLAPFGLAGPALIQVGVIPLVVIGAFAAVRRRSWGLAYLTLAGTLGLVEAETLRSVRPANDDRILWLATAVAMFAALVGISVLVGALSRPRQRLAVFAIGLLALLPAVVPRAISGTQLALGGLSVGHLAGTDSVDRSAVRTQFGLILEANWDFYAWLARSLSTDARLLTTQPAAIASLAGIASPTSGRHLQSLAQYATPTYEDALRFLHRDDLQEMGITHLHVTDDHAAALTPEARRLLDNPAHFKLLTDQHSASGQRHRLFEVLPGAGTSDVALSSYRRLRQIVPVETPVTLVGGLSVYARRMLLFNFIDHLDLRAPESTDVNRATRVARFRTDLGISDQGVVVLPESLEPTALGLSADDAFWTGYGTRAYRPSDTWSSVWRVGSDVGGLPGDLVPLCEAADGTLEFQVLGAPGTPVAAGSKTWDLTGVPQQFRLSVPDCGALAIVADADIAPFARVRASQPASLAKRDRRVAGLGFDGHVEGEHLVVNLWYQNPHRIAFDAEAHLRLYEADATGTVPALPDFIRFARRWDRPLVLTRDSQMARIEFDARRLEINGSEGGGWVSRLAPGRSYVLMLTVAEYDPASEHVDFHQLLPLARLDVRDAKVDYEVFSGIVALRHLVAGSSAISRLQAHHGWLGVDMDLTPPRAAGSENP
ncbi:MAG: hypothetical protein OXI70_15295 [Chloroflexota bacterium]|nr:hypothetical protein [Chloroflexota bacterium]